MTRKSKQKEAILRIVGGTNCHPTADWIYQEARSEIPNISLGTVYRNLKLLKEEGKILELDSNGTSNRFDGNTQYHHHFVCEQCGSILDVTSDEQMESAMLDSIAQSTGFKITHHRYELRGLCQDCQSGDS